MQIALQQELEMPAWRKSTAFFTAFVEGWGLYSERLGIDMGLYDTPQKDMGRLSYQMWRATRLVVDTGIHSKGWDKAQAVAFMKDNSALTDANIDAEVNRYISVPGQALAYKIGELKIEELAGDAPRRRLGPSSTSAASTTPCSARARCRSTRSKRRSTRGSPRSKARRLDPAYCSGAVCWVDVFATFLAGLVDHLLHAAGVAGRPDRRAAVDAGASDASRMLRALLAQAVRCARPAFAKPFRDAVALCLGPARADHDFVVGRARAGVGAVNDDLADAVVRACASAGRGERRPGRRPEQRLREGLRASTWSRSFQAPKADKARLSVPQIRFESPMATLHPARIAAVSRG